MNLTIISGLPGAGKTTYGKQLEKEGYILVDDPTEKVNFDPDQKYVVTDPNLCRREVFDQVNIIYPQAFWIFFKPDPLTCWANIQKRKDRKVSICLFNILAKELTSNFDYYLAQTKDKHKIKETQNVLV